MSYAAQATECHNVRVLKKILALLAQTRESTHMKQPCCYEQHTHMRRAFYYQWTSSAMESFIEKHRMDAALLIHRPQQLDCANPRATIVTYTQYKSLSIVVDRCGRR